MPLNYHLSGVKFTSITSDGVIRIKDEISTLVLEHNSFTSITSWQDGGCVFFNPGYSIYQKDICANNVYSGTKSKYCLVNIPQASSNIDFVYMISLTDSITEPAVYDMAWLAGGQTSISYYNSSNNLVTLSPACYFENSVGRANASFINAISGIATHQDVIYSRSECIIQYSNFYKNTVRDMLQCLFMFDIDGCSIDHCVFLENTATYFSNRGGKITSCSFHGNSFGSVEPSVPYTGTNRLVINTQCHLGNQNVYLKRHSCVSRYFTTNHFVLLYSTLFFSV